MTALFALPSRRRYRRPFFAVAALAAAALSATLFAGCGGSSNAHRDDSVTVHTGGSGSFADSFIGPTVGSTYISSGTIFQIAWPYTDAPPPAEFTASLHRYKEARGSANRSDELQKITVTQAAGTAAWNIARSDGFTLDTDGVYYLRITSPGQYDLYSAYIVASGRSVPLGGGNSRAVNTGQNGSVEDVEITPTPGTVFLPKHTTFHLQWPAGTVPPASFDVNLVRYQEAIGGEDRAVGTQKIDITASGTNGWNVARRDNFDLDQGGVYYLEVTAPGENPVRAAYIVSQEQ